MHIFLVNLSLVYYNYGFRSNSGNETEIADENEDEVPPAPAESNGNFANEFCT